ncbi:MAG: glycosyltransferase family 2 protein [Spirochaetales bacterium]
MSPIDYPLVTVVIPAFGRSGLTRCAIDSVLDQTYQRVELIVVDDNGQATNASRRLQSELSDLLAEGRVRYVQHKENSGAAVARNTGIREASGSLLGFLDTDDYWYPEKLERQVDAFLASHNSDTGIVYGKELITFKNSDSRYIRNSRHTDFLKAQLLRGVASTSSLLLTRDMLEEVGGFRNLPSSQESDLLLRAFSAGWKAVFVPEVLIRRSVGDVDSITASKTVADRSWLTVREPYLPLVPSRVRRRVRSNYHLLMANRYLKTGSRVSSSRQFLRAIASDPFYFRVYGHCVKLLTGRRGTKWLRRAAVRLRNRIP